MMLTFMHLPCDSILAHRRSLDEGFKNPLCTYRVDLIAVLMGAILPWVSAGIAALLDVDFGGDLLYYGLLCTVALQFAVYRASSVPRRDSHVFFTTLGFLLVYVGALAAAIVAGLHILWTLVMPLLAPLAYGVARAVLLSTSRGKKQGTTPAP